MTRVQTILLGIIAAALVAILVVQVAPPPFEHCRLVPADNSAIGISGGYRRDCDRSWWPL